MIRLVVIGLGSRAAGLLKCLEKVDPQVELSAVVDPDPAGVRRRLDGSLWRLEERQFISLDEFLARASQFDGALIASRCHLHTPLACAAAKTGLPLFLEKPVAITHAQLDALAQAFTGRMDSVVVSFPLRVTPLFRRVREILRSGELGTVNHVQAVNFAPYGGVYFSRWHRDYDLNGGLWLQKATHDFDYLNQLIDTPPRRIAAMETRRIYGGEKPPELWCSACDSTATCPESPVNIQRRGDDGGICAGDHVHGGDHPCVFSSISNRHHDAASCLIWYEGGILASYTQNFVARRSAATRGARITGYLATLEFDWHHNSLTWTEHHGRQVKTESLAEPVGGHGGGDTELLRNFLAVIRRREASISPLQDGILSAAMSLAARDAVQSGRSEPVRRFGNRPTGAFIDPIGKAHDYQ